MKDFNVTLAAPDPVATLARIRRREEAQRVPVTRVMRAALMAIPGVADLFTLTPGQSRRARVQSIHDRTGWVFARCREMVDTMTDVQIEAAVRQHEATARRSR